MHPTRTPDAAQPISTRGMGQNRPMPQPILHTARLTLAPLSDEHLDLEAELDAHPQVMRYLTGRASTRAEVERAHQRRLAAAREVPGLGFWAGFAYEQFIGWWLLRPAPRAGPAKSRRPGRPGLPAAAPTLAPRLRHRRRSRTDPLRLPRRRADPDLRPDPGRQHPVPGHHDRRRAHLHPRLPPPSTPTTARCPAPSRAKSNTTSPAPGGNNAARGTRHREHRPQAGPTDRR